MRSSGRCDLRHHKMELSELTCRALQPQDDIAALTALLHRAYKPLLDMGLRFWASHQSVDDTRQRIVGARCLVACQNGAIVGTILYYTPAIAGGSPWYDKPSVARFGQFAVDPERQGCGVGARLLAEVERQAQADGARELALDTSEKASHLVHYYRSKGYRFIEFVQWDIVNYRSVILSKLLAPARHTGGMSSS